MTVCIKCREEHCDCNAGTIEPAHEALSEVKRVRDLLAAIKAKKEGRP